MGFGVGAWGLGLRQTWCMSKSAVKDTSIVVSAKAAEVS